MRMRMKRVTHCPVINAAVCRVLLFLLLTLYPSTESSYSVTESISVSHTGEENILSSFT